MINMEGTPHEDQMFDPETQIEMYLLKWGNRGVIFSRNTVKELRSIEWDPAKLRSFLYTQDEIIQSQLGGIIERYEMEGIPTPRVLAHVEHLTDVHKKISGFHLTPVYKECPECRSIRIETGPYLPIAGDEFSKKQSESREFYCGNCGLVLGTERTLELRDGLDNVSVYAGLFGIKL